MDVVVVDATDKVHPHVLSSEVTLRDSTDRTCVARNVKWIADAIATLKADKVVLIVPEALAPMVASMVPGNIVVVVGV